MKNISSLRAHDLALMMCGMLVGVTPLSHGHEGHDHGPAPISRENVHSPQRLADGAIFLPKSSQRQLRIRTQEVLLQNSRRSIELPGLVAMDPNAGGRVQATVPGRIEPGPAGLPALGQSVQKGQVLARVQASMSPADRAALGSQLAELSSMHALAARRVERLRLLADSVPRKEIEAAEAELLSLTGRLNSWQNATTAEPLVAPISGVIASSRAVSGQVVDARELVFEIIDPGRLWVEVTAPGVGLGEPIDSASVRVANRVVPLTFLGAGRVLRDQSLPLQFRAHGTELSQLSVGQPIAVMVKLKAQVQGVPLPLTALVRSSANEPLVWVKSAPERFEPRRVLSQPLDGTHVLVTQGLDGGEIVVTEGAPLIHQIR
jgi:cobalt-zinc-cadmium efflux system membrane fusion protein